MTEEEFRDYIAAFNRDDFNGFSRFYAPDMVMALGGEMEIHGRDAVLALYRDAKARARRQIKVNTLIVGADTIAAELESDFEAIEDAPDLPSGPLRKGERFHHVSFVFYDVVDGCFSRIRAARFKGG